MSIFPDPDFLRATCATIAFERRFAAPFADGLEFGFQDRVSGYPGGLDLGSQDQ